MTTLKDVKDCPRREWLIFNDWFNPLPIAKYPCTCGQHGDAQPTMSQVVASLMPESYRIDANGVAKPKGM